MKIDRKLPEEALIEYAKPYLKQQGFRKKNKRWTKQVDGFTLCFFIQGSVFDKELYYIRPGVWFDACEKSGLNYYGHVYIEIPQTTAEEVMEKAMAFFQAWSDRAYVRETVQAFQEWNRRHPPEKRRAWNIDMKKDPPPGNCSGLFELTENQFREILEML